MNPLLVVIPFCSKDHTEATRLLRWIKELDGQHTTHACLLAADNAVPVAQIQAVLSAGKEAFSSCTAMLIKAPAAVKDNYHVPAAVMFEQAARQVNECYKWNWLWLEPDAVPLKSGWLDALSEAYDASPKRFMGSIVKPGQKELPETVMFGTAVYPNCAHPDLKKFCDGKTHFDIAFSPYVVPRAQDTPLIWHRWGSPTDVPTFKPDKSPGDSPNVGTLDMIPSSAVLFHRNKDGSLIKLLREALQLLPPCDMTTDELQQAIEFVSPPPVNKGGRPRKVPLPTESNLT